MDGEAGSRVDVDIGIVLRGGKVLICQRRAENTFGGYWEFPGGKREPGELPEQCLARELWEEVAIRVGTLQPLDPIEHNYLSTRVRLHPHVCAHADGEPRPLACQQTRWVEPAALRDYRFPPANDALIDLIIERLARRDPDDGCDMPPLK